MDDTLNTKAQGVERDPDPDEQPDAETLYAQGMAHYRRREWQRAMEYFVRLKALQPNRPGIDALLDELDWFIQLQAMGPEAQAAEAGTAHGGVVPEPEVREVAPSLAKVRRTPVRFNWRVLIWPLVLLLIALGAYFVFKTQQPDPIDVLYNRAQAKMTVGDYEEAIQIYEQILERDPNHKGAQFGLDKARRLANLSLLYQNAKTYIANEQWDLAWAELNKILEIDPTYSDASTLASFVERRKTVVDLYKEGRTYYESGEWGKAIDRFERIRSLDATFNAQLVRNMLLGAYINEAKRLLDDPASQAADIRLAIQHLSSALTINPQASSVAAIKSDAESYLAGLVAFGNGEFDLAHARFSKLYAATGEYTIRNAGYWLYKTFIARGDALRDGGRYADALAQYRQAQGVVGVDTSEAREREADILANYATPTPTATPTRTPTRTRAPTNTPVPPTPTPIQPTQPPAPPPPTVAPTNTPVPPTVAPTNTPIPPTPTRPPR